MQFQKGDVVVLKMDYNEWSKAGCMGIVKSLDCNYAGTENDLVTFRVLLSDRDDDTCCFAYRLEKVGHIDI